ncbi:MAG: histidine kinase, partial [Bacteroidota bacterium]
VISVLTVVSFLLATWALPIIFSRPALFPTGQDLFAIGTVAFSASILVTGYLALVRFRQHAQNAQVETDQALNLARDAELRALRAQVDPHFLFNALNTIAALIRTRPAEAERVTEHLADVFRYSLSASEQPLVSVGDELAAIETYLDIERARFPERLHTVIDLPAGLKRVQIPSLSLQPLVENAIKHGVSQTDRPCTVRIAGRLEGEAPERGIVRFEVTDTGPGPSHPLPVLFERGHGLRTLDERLRRHFGTHLERLPNGFAFTVPRKPAS